MKIAVASQNRREVTGHLGRCRKFWIYEVGTDRAVAGRHLLELEKSQSFHESSPHAPHPLDSVGLVICAGMGGGVQRRLAAKGIAGLVTQHTDPDAAVAAWLGGEPQPRNPG